MADGPECAGLDQLVRVADGRHEAVVEADHVLHACLGDGGEHGARFGGAPSEWFFTQHVLASSGRGDARLGMRVVGSAVVQELDVRVGNQLPPVCVRALVAEASRCRADRFGISSGDRREDGYRRGRIHHVRQCLECVRMGFAHEGVPQHAHTNPG